MVRGYVKKIKQNTPKTGQSSRDYINNNVILKINYSSNETYMEKKLNSIVPYFKKFIVMYSKKIKNINRKFPNLTFDTFDMHRGKDNKFYIYLYTQPFNNHPFLIFGDLEKDYFQIIVPLGNEIGQIETKILENHLEAFTKSEIIGLAILLNRTMHIRQVNITENPRYSLYKCDQIKQCKIKLQEIKSLKIPLANREQLSRSYQKLYKSKAIEILKYYFKLLADGKYDDAFEYLKGGQSSGSKYFGKTRINTFFVSNYKIIGHLEVFIYLYKFMEKLKKLL